MAAGSVVPRGRSGRDVVAPSARAAEACTPPSLLIISACQENRRSIDKGGKMRERATHGRPLYLREMTPVNSNSMPRENAVLAIAIARRPDGTVGAILESRLPGVAAHVARFNASADSFDEMTALMADFHNEWKAWGSLLDCVLDDWGGAQLRLL